MGGGDPGRPGHPQPAGDGAVQRRGDLAGAGWPTDAEILDWVAADARDRAASVVHGQDGPGSDPMAVVDPATMRVHGVDGLRVVDASVMPYVTNGNIYAPVMMLAEKAADLILGSDPLPPRDCRSTGIGPSSRGPPARNRSVAAEPAPPRMIRQVWPRPPWP